MLLHPAWSEVPENSFCFKNIFIFDREKSAAKKGLFRCLALYGFRYRTVVHIQWASKLKSLKQYPAMFTSLYFPNFLCWSFFDFIRKKILLHKILSKIHFVKILFQINFSRQAALWVLSYIQLSLHYFIILTFHADHFLTSYEKQFYFIKFWVIFNLSKF